MRNIGRREFVALAGAGLAAGQQREPAVVASATVDTTPRVAIVLSSFRGGADHDGTPIPGLEHPRPVDADQTSGEIDAMVRKAIDLAATRAGDLASAVEADAWVVIKAHILTDPRIVSTVISYLAERKRGLRFTVADGAAQTIEECARRFPGVRFEIADLKTADSIELPVPGKSLAHGVYRVPKIVQQCDRLISIAPLKTGTIANYLDIAPGPPPGSADEVMVDLFSYHPADFAIAVDHNLVIAGAKAVCVDAVAAAVMGFKPADLRFLALAERKGFGTRDIDSIWTRGNEIEQARRMP